MFLTIEPEMLYLSQYEQLLIFIVYAHKISKNDRPLFIMFDFEFGPMYHFWCDAGAVGNIAKLVLKNVQQVSYFYLN